MYTKIFTGPMFSGKTRKLITSLEKYVLAKKHVVWCEPACDTRGGSHGSYLTQRMKELKKSEFVHTINVKTPNEIITESLAINEAFEIAAIYIDEYHMLDFKRDFFYTYNSSSLQNIPLTFSGLIIGCDAIVLDVAKEVLPFMDDIIKENAICMKCGNSANYYNYIGNERGGVIDNGKNYECLCHTCWMKVNALQKEIEC